MRWLIASAVIVLVALAAWLLVPWRGAAPEIAATGDPARGEYVLRLAGCVSCHTDEANDGRLLAGGRALATPFGTFITPNITPDPRPASAAGLRASSYGRWRKASRPRATPTSRRFPTPPTSA